MSDHDDLDARLAALLAVPHAGDPAREARARTAALDALPTGRRWPRRVLRAAVPALGFAALGTVLVLAVPRGESPSAATPSPAEEPLGVLRTPQGPEDHLPAWVAADPAVVANAVDPASVRLAQASAGRLFLVAHGRASRRDDGLRPTGSRTVCLIVAVRRTPGPGFRPGRPGNILCALEDSFAWGNLTVSLPGTHRTVTTPSGTFTRPDVLPLITLVPDGYDTLHTNLGTFPVKANLARGAYRWTLRDAHAPFLTGPAGRRALAVDLPRWRSADLRWASFAGFQPSRPFDRPVEPRTMDLVASRIPPWAKRIAAGGRTTAIHRRDTVVLRSVPVPVAGTVIVTVSGVGKAESTALGAGGYGAGYGGALLTPYRRR